MTKADLPAIALSVRQPWAWAIIHGGKDIENRSRHAVANGNMKPARICIHASAGMTRDEYEHARELIEQLGVKCPRPDELIRGAIIGTVDVIDVVKEHASQWFYGQTSNDRGLVLRDPRPCDPVSCKGELGYFAWKESAGDRAQALPWMIKWPGAVAAPPAIEAHDPDLFSTGG
jgi:hypothetical protein